MLMGLFGREIVAGTGGGDAAIGAVGSGAIVQSAEAGTPPATFAVEVRAVLELPTATPTSTPRPSPTMEPDVDSQLDFCADEQPGKVCRVPYPPPPTPTPYPSCGDLADLEPGSWCVWPTEPAAAPVWMDVEGRSG